MLTGENVNVILPLENSFVILFISSFYLWSFRSLQCIQIYKTAGVNGKLL